MTDVDVLVVGGGPVGLASAIEARLAGLTVALVEPREGEIDKACGEGLMPGALRLLARLGVDADGMPLRGVSYRTPTRRADHLFRSGEGRGVRRTTLHHALAARAEELGGTVVVLGQAGRNFAAGMSGGIAYVYDVKGRFADNCNPEMVDLDPVINGESEELYNMISRHYAFTGSTVARFIMDDFDNQLKNFVKVYPQDYKKAIQKTKIKVEEK